MRLDIYLHENGYAESRSRAVHLIKTGNVLVNGAVRLKQSFNVRAGDSVEVLSDFRFVSRAGYKIEAVFRKHGLSARGLRVLDVGCSTGGFSDFFLQDGAEMVVGVDIAESGVDGKVLSDPRFRFRGRVNALDTGSLNRALGGERFDMISVDVSNALLKEVLPNLNRFLKEGGRIIALFKPPYEISRIIKSPEEAAGLTAEFDAWVEQEYKVLYKEISPIKGGSKNRGTMELVYVLGRLDQPSSAVGSIDK